MSPARIGVSIAALAMLAFSSTIAAAQIKIGITVSASGPGAALGQPQLKTIAALPKEIAGQKVTYIGLDDESDATKAVQNARKMITEDKVDVLVGSSLTPVTFPLIDIAAENKIPLMTLAAAAALVQPMDDKKKWVFKVVPNDDLMAKAIMKIIAKSGVKKLGYIGFSDGYGEGYWKELSALAPKMGIEITTHEVYARGDQSVTGQILKIIASKPDAVFIAAAGTPAVLPQKALRERGYKGPVYQTHGIVSDAFLKLGGKDVEGAMFTGEAFTVVNDLPADSPFRKVPQAYTAAFKAANGGAAPDMFGAHLWDSITLIEKAAPAALAKAKPGTPEFRAALRDEIEKGKDVYLNNGLSSMSPTDHNGYDDRTAIPIKIEDNKFRLMK
ncbi:MAG: ABC transporter substrate-binding protein [Hyphomicrobiales bacterium]|nr:ABC transporter substrate-binding protein [Hyphomicrobiales bacterium]